MQFSLISSTLSLLTYESCTVTYRVGKVGTVVVLHYFGPISSKRPICALSQSAIMLLWSISNSSQLFLQILLSTDVVSPCLLHPRLCVRTRYIMGYRNVSVTFVPVSESIHISFVGCCRGISDRFPRRPPVLCQQRNFNFFMETIFLS